MLRWFKSCCSYLAIIVLTLICVVFIESQDWELSIKLGVYGLLVAVSGLLLFLAQLKQIYLGFERGRLRHKKEATLKIYNKIEKNIRGLNKKLEEKFSLRQNDPKIALSREDLQFIFSVGGKSSRQKLEEMLSALEMVGLGVKHDIYDFDVVKDLSATFLLQIYLQYEPYIAKVREDQIKRGVKVIRYEQLIRLVKMC